MNSLFAHTRGFLFDFDGTLIQQRIDFDRMRRDVWDLVERFGVPVEPLKAMYVLELIEHVARVLAEQGGDREQAFRVRTRQAIVDIELEAAEGAEAFPGVPEMMHVLVEGGWHVGIVTRNCRPAVERVLALVPLRHDVLLTRDDVVRAKPDPEHLAAALRAMEVPAAEAAMCGDHPMDVLAGQRAGTLTVGVLGPHSPADYFQVAKPDLVLSRVTDLLDYLAR